MMGETHSELLSPNPATISLCASEVLLKLRADFGLH